MTHNILKGARLLPLGKSGDTSMYEVSNKSWHNRYYIASSDGTRRLMASPEVVGFDSYLSMVPSTIGAMEYLKSKGLSGPCDILSILRGGLNYPLEEACFRCGIPLTSMSFLSCERVIKDKVITGLDIKYEKVRIAKNVQILIGDIIASGETLERCFDYLAKKFIEKGGSIRRIVFFTIGGTRAIKLLEERCEKLRSIWPEFEGFDCVFYEGVFTVYEDYGVTGVNVPMIDFGWKSGIVAPEFREYAESLPYALFEKCIIYDGGARRYEIPEHIEEVCQYWIDLHDAAKQDIYHDFICEKLGYDYPCEYDRWIEVNHYSDLGDLHSLYLSECAFVEDSLKKNFRMLAKTRLSEFKLNMKLYEQD